MKSSWTDWSDRSASPSVSEDTPSEDPHYAALPQGRSTKAKPCLRLWNLVRLRQLRRALPRNKPKFLLTVQVITAKKPQFVTPNMSGSFLVAKNGSFVTQDTVVEEWYNCSTPACKSDGTYLKEFLSCDLDLGDGLYHFVCSHWKGASETSKPNVAAATSDQLDHQLEQSVRGVLQCSSSPENLATLKRLFYECMNTRQLDLDNWNPMLELLWLVSLQGFPFTSTPRNSTSLWKIAARVLTMTGAQTLLSMQATARPTKGDTGILITRMPNMLAPKGSDQAQVTQFHKNTAFASNTVQKKHRNATTYSFEVAAFASCLEMHVYTYTVSVGLSTRRLMLLKTHPEMSTFFAEWLLNSDSLLYSGRNRELLIQSPAFFDAFVTMLWNTEHNIVMNYLGIHLMMEVGAYASSSRRASVHTLVQPIYGSPLLPRRKLCMRSAERAWLDLFFHSRHASKHTLKTHSAADMGQRLLGSLRLQLARSLSRLAVPERGSRVQVYILLNIPSNTSLTSQIKQSICFHDERDIQEQQAVARDVQVSFGIKYESSDEVFLMAGHSLDQCNIGLDHI
ncbi:hypothetical protein HPB51_029616 [Rhipicephalus microplus]|uniref:Peptidase M13 N-terminal domain-containing protein n=1 Tax=Rhipicephalus microplus TaxID=6941 RepID=A0A9J6CU95_RHIMP|nr:hypothetical protein HPB51_029616 [Rhipicephalus microplus]